MPPICISGDIHGRADLLKEVVTKVRERFGPTTRFIGVGDFIDRGPDSPGVEPISVDYRMAACCADSRVFHANSEAMIFQGFQKFLTFFHGSIRKLSVKVQN